MYCYGGILPQIRILIPNIETLHFAMYLGPSGMELHRRHAV